VQPLTYKQLLLENRNFRNLLAGQFISELGNWFNFIAGLGLVRLESEGSPTAAGVFFVCRLVPFAIASPIAGTFVDRFSRRQVMIITDLARVAVAMMFLLVTNHDDLWIAYVATILLSTFGAFFDGAKNAATPNLTGKDGLLAGTALMFSTRFLLMAIGSALGGWAAAIFGYEVAFLINAASFLVSAFTVWLIPEEVTRDSGFLLTAGLLDRDCQPSRAPLNGPVHEPAPVPVNVPTISQPGTKEIGYGQARGMGSTGSVRDEFHGPRRATCPCTVKRARSRARARARARPR
jgi:MFS family permease